LLFLLKVLQLNTNFSKCFKLVNMIQIFAKSGMLSFEFGFKNEQNELSIYAYITAIPALQTNKQFGGTKLNKDKKINFSLSDDELLLLRALVLKEIDSVSIIREGKSIQFKLVQDQNNSKQYLILANVKAYDIKFTIPIQLIPFRYKLVKIIDYLYDNIIASQIKINATNIKTENLKFS